MSEELLIDDREFLTPIYLPVAEVVRKFQEAQHPRDTKGRFTETASVTVGDRQIQVVKPKRAAGDVLVPINVVQFDAAFATQPDFYIGVGGGKNAIHDRYPKFGEYIATHDSIEASEVTVNADGRVGFTNGRHRYAWLRDQGLTSIPVAMTPESIQHAKKHGYLAAVKLAWDESQHPRDPEGQFTEHATTVHGPGSSVQLPGRYDRTQLPPHSFAITTEHGYILATQSSDNPYYWVNHIRVSDRHQGQGEGSALFIAAAAEAIRQGAQGLMRGDIEDRPASAAAQAVWAKLKNTSTYTDAKGFIHHVLKWDARQPRDAKGRWVDLGLHDGQVTVLHGTTRQNAEAILTGGFKPGNPAGVAAQVEHEYGLPKDSVLNHVAFEFARGRHDLGDVHFTTDEAVADQYSVPEVLQDALTSAHMLLHPTPEDVPFTKALHAQRKAWIDREAKRLAEPALLAVTVPFETVGQHSFGRQFTLDQFKDLLTKFPGAEADIFNNIRIPIPALAGARIERRKWDEAQHPRDAEGQFTTFYHGTVQEQVASIQVQGLQTTHAGLAWPGLSQPGTIYLGRTPEAAMMWAESTALRLEWKFNNPTAVVLEIAVPAEVLAKSQRTADPEGNLRVFQNIPPAWIKSVTVGKSHDAIVGLPPRLPQLPQPTVIPPFVHKQETVTGYVGLVLEGEPRTQKQEHAYGNTQIQIDAHSTAAASLNTARNRIRDEDLMGTGKDVDPNHVTVRFGLVNDDLDALRSFIAAQSPFEARVIGIELFPASEHSEGAVPVVARIASPELRLIEEEIGKHAAFKEKNFPVYKPHCTLAYCKPEAAPRYADLLVGGSFLVHDITISHASGVKETIPFGMPQRWVVAKRTAGTVNFHNHPHWDESKHPRRPSGSAQGGEFTETLHGPGDALDSLLNKEKNVSIDRGDVRKFLKLAARQPEDPDLTDLQVEGMEIFGGNGLGIERDDMPQIPRDHRKGLLTYLEQQGVTITEEQVDPFTLKPTQNQISARNVGEKLAEYEKGDKKFPPTLVSTNSRILDGHHHWGMMAAFALDVPNVTMPIYRIHTSTKRALALMKAYMRIHGLKRKTLSGAKVAWDEAQHPRDAEGQFVASLVVEAGRVQFKSREKLIEMPIAEFLQLAEPGIEMDKTALVRSILDRGETFSSLPHLQYELRKGQAVVTGHEGRHRARELQRRGFTTMPVILRGDIRWSEQDNSKLFDYQQEWPERLQSQRGAVPTSIPFPVSREQAGKPYEKRTKKADPQTGRYVTPFVSFDKQGDDQLRMIASLNSSRLATWGFTAEAEVRGMARYRLTAVLDGRTSEFCKIIDGKIFEVEDAREKVIEVLNVQNPEDLKVVQPWPKQTKQALAEFEEMSAEELTARGFHIPPYHPYCRTICRVIEGSEGEEMDVTPTIPQETETFQAVTEADLAELGIEATPEQVDQWNEHIGMSPVELISKLTDMRPQEILTKGKGVGANPIQIDPKGAIGVRARGESEGGVEFKVGAILDPFTGIYYLTQAELLAGTPKAELAFVKNLFLEMINTGLKTTASSVAIGVAGNAAYYAKLGFLPDELEWDTLRTVSLNELETGALQPLLASLSVEDRRLVLHLLQDGSPSALSALVELPFIYQGRTLGEWLLAESEGTWGLDLTDDAVVAQAKAYLS